MCCWFVLLGYLAWGFWAWRHGWWWAGLGVLLLVLALRALVRTCREEAAALVYFIESFTRR